MAPPLRVAPLAMGVAVLLTVLVAVTFATAVAWDGPAAGGDAFATCAAPAGAFPAAADGASPPQPASGGECGCSKGLRKPLPPWERASLASPSLAKRDSLTAATAASGVTAPATDAVPGCAHCAAAAAAGGKGGSCACPHCAAAAAVGGPGNRCACPHCASAAGKVGKCGCGCPRCVAVAAPNDTKAGGCGCPQCVAAAGMARGGCKCARCAAAATAGGKPGACTCPDCVAAAAAATSGAHAAGCGCVAAAVAGGEKAETGAACGCPHCAAAGVLAGGGSVCDGCNHPGCPCRAAAAARVASSGASTPAAAGTSSDATSSAAEVIPAASCGCSRCGASGIARGSSGRCSGCDHADCPCRRATVARLSDPVGHLTPPPPAVTLTPTELDGDWAVDLLVVGVPASGGSAAAAGVRGGRGGRLRALRLPAALESLDTRLGGALAAALGSSSSFRGTAGTQSPTLLLPAGGPVLAAVFVGLGPPAPSGCTGCAAPPMGMARLVGEAAATAAATLDASVVGVWVPDMATAAAGVATGVTAGAWVDRRFKGGARAASGAANADAAADVDASADADNASPREVLLLGAPSGEAATAVAHRSAAIGRGVVLARQLVEGPANVVTPAVLAGVAANISAMGDGWRLVVLDAEGASSAGMGAFAAVAAGGGAPSRFIHLAWTPPGGAEGGRAVALVGKGITYDSGGYNLKVGAASMIDKMKVGAAGGI